MLIAIGVSIIFRKNPWVKGIVWILLIAAVIAYGYFGDGRVVIFGHQVLDYNLTEKTTAVELRNETELGKIDLNLGAGAINIGSTDEYAVLARYPDEITDFTAEFTNGDKKFELRMDHDDKYLPRPRLNVEGLSYDLDLQEDVLWDFDIDMGAMDLEMDLRDLGFETIDLDLGAGDIDLYLGDLVTMSKIYIDSGVSDIRIYIPEDAAVKIKFDGGIKDIDFDGDTSFRKYDEYYQTDNYETSDLNYYFDINTGLGDLVIEQY